MNNCLRDNCFTHIISRRYVAFVEQRKPECFSKAAGDYTKFVLYKENTDTLHAISVMAKYLRYTTCLHLGNDGELKSTCIDHCYVA